MSDDFDPDTCELSEGSYCAHLWDLWQAALAAGDQVKADELEADLLANLGPSFD